MYAYDPDRKAKIHGIYPKMARVPIRDYSDSDGGRKEWWSVPFWSELAAAEYVDFLNGKKDS